MILMVCHATNTLKTHVFYGFYGLSHHEPFKILVFYGFYGLSSQNPLKKTVYGFTVFYGFSGNVAPSPHPRPPEGVVFAEEY